MLTIQRRPGAPNCQGFSRRTAVKAGFLGATGLTLADRLAMKASGAPVNDKAVILIWLDGGPSQLETYDPKPDAPVEYRGPFGIVNTNVPGIQLSDTLPLHAKHADKMAFVRSLHHDNGDHFAAAHWMLTGRFGSTSVNKSQMHPSVGSYIAKVKGSRHAGMPAYVGVPAAESVYLYPGYQGAAYLGGAYDPFQVNMKQKYLSATYKSPIKPPEWLSSVDETAIDRTQDRLGLLNQLDAMKRRVDQTGTMELIDEYQQQAVDLLLNGRAQQAFDMEQESEKDRDRYGRGPWGHYTLMARRLVQHGVSFVTVDMPHWDNHSKIQEGHGSKLVHVDRAVSALIEDLDVMGMLDDVMVVVMGEFGRTPRLNKGQPGIPIPGRDHWGNAISAMVAGGGVRGGQVIGATNGKAEHPIARPLKPADLLASIYYALGIDASETFPDHAGRPVAISDGEPISELFTG